MIFWLILFAIGLVGTLGMLVWRLRALKAGRMEYVDRRYEHLSIPALSEVSVKREHFSEAKKHTHSAIISIIKFWVIISHLAQKETKRRFPKLHDFIVRKSSFTKSYPVSRIKAHLSEYGRKMKKFKQKLKEYEETKEELKKEDDML